MRVEGLFFCAVCGFASCLRIRHNYNHVVLVLCAVCTAPRFRPVYNPHIRVCVCVYVAGVAGTANLCSISTNALVSGWVLLPMCSRDGLTITMIKFQCFGGASLATEWPGWVVDCPGVVSTRLLTVVCDDRW